MYNYVYILLFMLIVISIPMPIDVGIVGGCIRRVVEMPVPRPSKLCWTLLNRCHGLRGLVKIQLHDIQTAMQKVRIGVFKRHFVGFALKTSSISIV